MRNRAALVALLAALAAAGTATAAAEPAAQRRQDLLYLLKQDCGSCHGLTLKGGLGPALLPQALAGKSDDALVDTILHGRPGTPMPPWSFSIQPEEARWLVETLRNGNVDG